MRAIRIRLPIFRLLYNSAYGFLLLLLLGLLGITPFDHIYQTVVNDRLGNVFVVGGVYIGTGLVALFIYFSRLYTNRANLAAIPRSYLPIQKTELSRAVWRLVVRNRQRSALVAWDSRPRDLTRELTEAPSGDGRALTTDDSTFDRRVEKEVRGKKSVRNSSDDGEPTTIIPVDPASPPWGHVRHPGWSSPGSRDMPSLQFITIVVELPNLLEARAVSFAPEDHAFEFLHASARPDGEELRAPPDPQAVAMLQRPRNMGLREYLAHLRALGMFADTAASERAEQDFLMQYEYARFSLEALTEREFRALMARFSRILSDLRPPTMPSASATLAPAQHSDAPPVSERAPSSMASFYHEFAADAASIISSTGSVVHHFAGD